MFSDCRYSSVSRPLVCWLYSPALSLKLTAPSSILMSQLHPFGNIHR